MRLKAKHKEFRRISEESIKNGYLLDFDSDLVDWEDMKSEKEFANLKVKDVENEGRPSDD